MDSSAPPPPRPTALPTRYSSRSTAWRATGARRVDLTRFVPLLAIVLLVAISAGLAYLLVDEDRALQRDALASRHRHAGAVDCRCGCRRSAKRPMHWRATQRARSGRSAGFVAAAREAMVVKPEIVHVAFVDDDCPGDVVGASPGPLGESVRSPNSQLTVGASGRGIEQCTRGTLVFLLAGLRRLLRVGRPGQRRPFTDLVAPISARTVIAAPWSARVSLPELLRRAVAPDVAQRYRVSLVNDAGDALASTTASETPADATGLRRPDLPAPGRGLAAGFDLSRAFIRCSATSLAWVVCGLTLAVMARSSR